MSHTVAVNEFGIRIGEDHQNAKYPNAAIERVLELRDFGISYKRIAKICTMPDSTVACICKATRRCQIAAAFKKVMRG